MKSFDDVGSAHGRPTIRQNDRLFLSPSLFLFSTMTDFALSTLPTGVLLYFSTYAGFVVSISPNV